MAVVRSRDQSRPTTQKDRRESLQVANLQPLKRKLDKIETERIYRISQSVVSNIKQVQLISWFLENDSNIFRVTDEELRQLLLYHQHIGETNFIENNEIGKQKLQKSLKSILRYCSDNNVNLSSYQPVNLSFDYISVMVDHLEELVKIVYERLLTESDEEVARSKYLLQTMEKRRSAQNAIVSLEQTLKDRKNEREHIINEKDRTIRQLTLALETLKTNSEDENNTTLNDAAKQILTNQKTLEHKKNKYIQEIISSKEEGEKARKINYDKESKLRKRKFKMAGELQNWILKYDQDMGWRQEQIDEITMLNKKELEEISELEKHFNSLEKQYEAIIEERRVRAEEKKKRDEEERQVRIASIVIQSIWRGYRARRDFKKAGKKPGKGKGKGGKKKK